MPRTAPISLGDVLEKTWDRDLFNRARPTGLAVMLGWTSYHTLRSRGSRPGFPDRVLWKDRTIFAELKRELTGKKSEDQNRQPSPAQVRILDGLSKGGSEVYLWRPSDEQEISHILGKPWRFVPLSRASTEATSSFESEWPYLFTASDAAWTPKSLWIPGYGRADGEGLAG